MNRPHRKLTAATVFALKMIFWVWLAGFILAVILMCDRTNPAPMNPTIINPDTNTTITIAPTDYPDSFSPNGVPYGER